MDDYLAEETNMDSVLFLEHKSLDLVVEKQKSMLEQAEGAETKKAKEVADHRYHRTVDGMHAVDNQNVFVEHKPDWSGTIDVKSSNEKGYYKRVGKLEKEHKCVIDFKRKNK
uniref:Uncharacterized protein LOC104241278 n=1 Tax=Nicotiana sylvestris TaxID=4096 RepID=A0A1U7Y5K0_NICSY|nr:PREDICTED: uncharacterized protein LOC104241278 [Nicotiana sylvestris]